MSVNEWTHNNYMEQSEINYYDFIQSHLSLKVLYRNQSVVREIYDATVKIELQTTTDAKFIVYNCLRSVTEY